MEVHTVPYHAMMNGVYRYLYTIVYAVYSGPSSVHSPSLLINRLMTSKVVSGSVKSTCNCHFVYRPLLSCCCGKTATAGVIQEIVFKERWSLCRGTKNSEMKRVKDNRWTNRSSKKGSYYDKGTTVVLVALEIRPLYMIHFCSNLLILQQLSLTS